MTQRRAAKNSRMCLFTASGASICTQWFASSTYLLKQTRTELNEVGGQEKGCCRIIKPKRYFLFYSKAILHKRIFKFIPRVLYAINEVCCHHALWTDSSKEKYKQTTNKRKRNQVLASLLRSRSLSRHATLLPTNVGRSVAWGLIHYAFFVLGFVVAFLFRMSCTFRTWKAACMDRIAIHWVS